MKEVLIKEYNNLEKLGIDPKIRDYFFDVNFINGAYCKINGDNPGEFLVRFINQDNETIIHESTIKNGWWVRTSIKYFFNCKIQVTDLSNNKVIYNHVYNAKDKRVYIHLDSKAIGDTLAWFPYVEEFRKKHDCEVIVSTFYNDWFKPKYPKLKFVEPGSEVSNIYAMYSVGWHYNDEGEVDGFYNPVDFKKHPLQKTCSDVLGLEYKEIKPKLSFKNVGSMVDGDYVVIAPHASAHAKYWNYPGGWQEIIDYLKNKGYKVVMITQEKLGDDWHDSKLGETLTGVIDKTGDLPIKNRANDIMNAKMFIGVGSGLSWLSWALGTPTVLISGFSAPYTEFSDCERIFTPPSEMGLCNSCFNRNRLDAGDWEWCPQNRDFECTKSIVPISVKKSIDKILTQ